MFNATSVEVRLDDEPVALPGFGVRVLACTVRRTPFETEATFKAFAKKGPFAAIGDAKVREQAVADFILSGQRFPAEVLAELKAQGHEQQYSRSALVEMYRVEERAKGQQVHGETRWACDAFPVNDAFDLVPTHWIEAPALEL